MNFSSKSFIRHSYLEAFLFSLMVATTETYCLYYFIQKGISSLSSALLATLPLVVASMIQLFCPRMIKDKHLSRGLVGFMVVQIFGLMIIAACAWFHLGIVHLLLGLSLYWIGGQNAGPLWLDWTSRFIPYDSFHLFIGKRNMLITFVALGASISLSQIIHNTQAFKYIFLFGLIARILSMGIQLKMNKTFGNPVVKEEALPKIHDDNKLELKSIIFSIFIWLAVFRFAVNLCAPFFLPHMIHHLKLDPLHYVMMTNIPLIGKMLTVTNWALASKGIRSFVGVQLTTLLITTLPIFWFMSDNLNVLLLTQLFSGIAWCGHEISTTLMLQETSYSRSRGLVAQYQALINLFCLAGALLGSQLLNSGYTIPDLFRISTASRGIISVAFIFFCFRYVQIKVNRERLGKYITNLLNIGPQIISTVGHVSQTIAKKFAK